MSYRNSDTEQRLQMISIFNPPLTGNVLSDGQKCILLRLTAKGSAEAEEVLTVNRHHEYWGLLALWMHELGVGVTV